MATSTALGSFSRQGWPFQDVCNFDRFNFKAKFESHFTFYALELAQHVSKPHSLLG